jgi:peroxygenase
MDTYRGFYALGFGVILSFVALLIIHVNFSYPTIPPGRGILSYIPDPFFRVWTATIHKDKHGSDSGTYDDSGRFIPQRFEDIFAKYGDEDGITSWQILNYFRGQRVVADPFGWGAAAFECEYHWAFNALV